jgi:hypothetical protein
VRGLAAVVDGLVLLQQSQATADAPGEREEIEL